MTERDYTAKLEELDRLLNDPAVIMEPAKVWSLLAEVSAHDAQGFGAAFGTGTGRVSA